MKTLSLKLPDALALRLATKAQQGQSKSALVRTVLEAALDDKSVPRGSCLDLAGDLVGCLQGPGDLSVNKKYMEGFGK